MPSSHPFCFAKCVLQTLCLDPPFSFLEPPPPLFIRITLDIQGNFKRFFLIGALGEKKAELSERRLKCETRERVE